MDREENQSTALAVLFGISFLALVFIGIPWIISIFLPKDCLILYFFLWSLGMYFGEGGCLYDINRAYYRSIPLKILSFILFFGPFVAYLIYRLNELFN